MKFGYQFLLAEINKQQPGPLSSNSLKPLWQGYMATESTWQSQKSGLESMPKLPSNKDESGETAGYHGGQM